MDNCNAPFAPGDLVELRWVGGWSDAVVWERDDEAGLYLVHDGSAEQWVRDDELRPRPMEADDAK